MVKALKRQIWIILGFCATSIFAQTTLVSNQAGLAQKKSEYRKSLGQLQGQVFTAYSSNSDLALGFVIEQYSQDMIFQADRKIESQGKQRILRLAMGDSFFYWVSVLKVKRHQFKLFYHRLALNLQGAIQSNELATFSGVELDVSQWETVSSLNVKTMGLFAFGVKTDWVEDGRRLTMALGLTLNPYGQILDSFRVALPIDFGVDEVIRRSAEINQQGDLAVVYEDLSGISLFSAKKELNHFHIIHRTSGKTYQERLASEGMIRELAVSLDPYTHEFVVHGFWSDWKQMGISGHVRGNFISTKLKNDSLIWHWKLEEYEWNEWQYRQLSGLMATKKSGKPESYFIRDIVPLSHGGCVILAEQYFLTRTMETRYVNGVPQTGSILLYNYGDIAALYLTPGGMLDTLVMTRKTQVGTSSNNYLFGFAYYVCAGSLNLIYNDDEGEMNRVMHVQIDNTFASEKEWLFRSENIPGSIVPYEGLQTDYCTLTIPIFRDKQWHWLQVYSND